MIPPCGSDIDDILVQQCNAEAKRKSERLNRDLDFATPAYVGRKRNMPVQFKRYSDMEEVKA